MDFSEIERVIVDYFENADAVVEYRECEWLLIQGESRISLTSLAATIHQISIGGHRGN